MWYASLVHAIAIALTLSLAPPEAVEPEPAEVAPPETVEPAEPLPDIVPQPEPEPEPEPTRDVEPTPEPEPEPKPEPPPASDDQALASSTTQVLPTRDRLGCDGRKKCRNMSIAGIVVGSVGLVATGVGVGLLVNRDEVVPESPTFVKTTHPPGLIAVTVGSGVLVMAALMLGSAHSKRNNDSARVQFGPTGLRF